MNMPEMNQTDILYYNSILESAIPNHSRGNMYIYSVENNQTIKELNTTVRILNLT